MIREFIEILLNQGWQYEGYTASPDSVWKDYDVGYIRNNHNELYEVMLLGESLFITHHLEGEMGIALVRSSLNPIFTANLHDPNSIKNFERFMLKHLDKDWLPKPHHKDIL